MSAADIKWLLVAVATALAIGAVAAMVGCFFWAVWTIGRRPGRRDRFPPGGSPIPPGQGNIAHGPDGHYEEWARRQIERQERERDEPAPTN